jgi:tRNA (guanine-N7-)-methyltransferase
MAGKRKLARFAEMKTFGNVLEVLHSEVLNVSHPLKGRWREEVFRNNNPLVLELGCGKGEYTVGMALKTPDKNFIGVDIKGARMWRGAKTALDEGIDNAFFLRTRIEFIDRFFGAGEVDEIWITFPDPQPQKSREKKRLTSDRFLGKYRKFLKNDGIVHLKTDNNPLYEYSKEIGPDSGFRVLTSTFSLYSDLPELKVNDLEKELLLIPTFYEKMFRDKGFDICYLKMMMLTDE